MESFQNTTNNNEIDAMCIPSTSGENDDCRISCTDTQSLRDIQDVIFEQFSNFANSAILKDTYPELLRQFTDSFKGALRQNIVINGLPFAPNKSNKLSSPEKQDQKQMVKDALFSKLSKTVANVANKRKFCPERCCRIFQIEQKHDLQNLKKAKIISPVSSSSLSSPVSSRNKDKNTKEITDFCKHFNSVQETVSYKLKQREKLWMKLSHCSNIKKQINN